MKFKSICIFLTLITSASTLMAAEGELHSTLQSQREQVVKRYIRDLQLADEHDISALFAKNGVVISTSRGKVDATDFFYSFLPSIESATTEFHQLFVNQVDSSRYAARFHFNFKLKDNEAGDGEYVDEFVFANGSAKLLAVYMFENLKFEPLER